MQFQQKLLTGALLLFLSVQAQAQDPSASFSSNGKCQNQEVVFTDASTTHIGTLTRWKWDFGVTGIDDDTSDQQSTSYTYDTPGTYQVKLLVWNSAGGIDSTIEFVTIFATPDAQIDVDVPCFPAGVTVSDASNVSPGFILTRLWNVEGLSFTSSSFTYNFGASGTNRINLAVSSDNGCIDTASLDFFQGNQPDISFAPSGPINICEGETQTITVTGADNYEWQDGSTDDAITPSISGFYVVTGFNGNMCSDTDSIEVNILPKPVANAGPDVTLSLGDQTTLLGSGSGSFSWEPPAGLSDANSANPIANPSATTTYVLTVIGTNGCFDTDTVIITVDAASIIPIHNMLTPNGDGKNDVWDLTAVPNLENASISVFNRWGWEVFKSESYQNDWNGEMNNELLPDGTYVYVIKFNDNSREPLTGTLEIFSNTTK